MVFSAPTESLRSYYRLLGRFEYPQVLVFTLKIKMVIPPLRSSVTSGHIKNIESNLNHIK